MSLALDSGMTAIYIGIHARRSSNFVENIYILPLTKKYIR